MSHALSIFRGCEETAKRMVLGPILIVFAVAEAAALILGLLVNSWLDCAVLVLAATAIAGGVVFTILELQRLGKEHH